VIDAESLHCLTIDEVARILQVSAQTVRRAIKAGEIPAVRIGRNLRVREVALRRLIASG
jgi:excisionase family DNA binding protein